MKLFDWTNRSKKGTDFANAKMWISKLIKADVFQGLKMNAMDLE